MAERGFEIDHTTLNRWVLHYTPLLAKKAQKYKRPIHRSWRMDETYIKIKSKWHYLSRAVDKGTSRKCLSIASIMSLVSGKWAFSFAHIS